MFTQVYHVHPPPIIVDDPSKSVQYANFLTDKNLSGAMTSMEGGRHSVKYKIIREHL